MEAKEKIELLEKSVKQLIEEEKLKNSTNLCNHHQDQIPVLLSNLLSQLDSLKEEDMIEQPQPQPQSSISNEEIMRELGKIKKQNSRTHWLLSVMIMLTLALQLSQVSVILKLKQGLTNPFKSIGNRVKRIFTVGHSLNEQELEKDAAKKAKQVPQIYSFPGLKTPVIIPDSD